MILYWFSFFSGFVQNWVISTYYTGFCHYDQNEKQFGS